MAEYSEKFLRFWEAWPANGSDGYENYTRKKDKKKCWEVWRKKGYDSKAEAIIHNVEQRRKYDKGWRDSKGGFLSAPLVFLNNERWDDGEFNDLRQRKTPSAPAQRQTEPLPDMSRWAIGANKLLMKRICRQPMGDKLQHVLAMKRQIVEEAEQDDANGEPWDRDEFISVVENGIEQALR